MRWRRVKRWYCARGWRRWLVLTVFVPRIAAGRFWNDLRERRNPLRYYVEYRRTRGMSWVHDWVDWLGGYPFEVAKPEEVFDFLRHRGFELCRLKTVGSGYGCNEFVFHKKAAS